MLTTIVRFSIKNTQFLFYLFIRVQAIYDFWLSWLLFSELGTDSDLSVNKTKTGQSSPKCLTTIFSIFILVLIKDKLIIYMLRKIDYAQWSLLQQ